MQITALAKPEVKLLQPKTFGDHRRLLSAVSCAESSGEAVAAGPAAKAREAGSPPLMRPRNSALN